MIARPAMLLSLALAPMAWAQGAKTPVTNLPKGDGGPTTVTTPALAVADPYAAEALIVERLDAVYDYNADGTGTKTDTWVATLKSAAAVNAFSVLSIPFASGTSHIEILYLRVQKPDGTVVETPATDAQDQPAPVTQQAPFYSDLHLLQIPVRGLGVGDRMEYQVRTVLTKAEAPGQFWGQDSFGRGVVVRERTVELRVPSDKYVQVSSPENPPQVTTEGAKKVYRWKGSQLKPSPKPEADGSTPPDPDADKPQPVQFTTFHSWAEVGEWYRGLAQERSAVTPALKARADELTQGAATERAKMDALYSFVSSHVRYVGVAFGIGRYQPHEAAVVLANQYGDCKDKHTLLAALLNAEGVDTSAVLIGAGVPFNKDVPMPADFNHLITLAHAGGKDVWLDATEEVAPFGMLAPNLRDKWALVVPAKGTPELKKTPAAPPFPQTHRFEAEGTLSSSGVMSAQVDVHVRGDVELLMRALLRSVTPGQWDRVSQYYAALMGFGGQTSNTTADQPDKTDDPLHMHYTYSRESYGDWDNFRIIPMLGGVNLPLTDAKEAPEKEIDFGGSHTDTFTSRIHLPEGYRADLPPAAHLHTDFATFDVTHRLESGKSGAVLVTERTLVVSVDKLPASRWTEYKKFRDAALSDGQPWIQLTSTASIANVGKHPPAPGENNEVAAELVRQAQQLILAHDYTTAEAKLDEAKSVNPKQAYEWSEMGYVASIFGKMNEAVDDYKKELSQHPEDEDSIRHLLAGAQLAQHKNDDAIATLNEDLQHNSKDEQGALMLGSLLSQRGSYADAEKALRSTLNATPDSTPVKLLLGGTLMHEGKAADGAAMLRDIATSSDDPTVLNNAAFSLADGAQELPVAEKAARRSLELLETKPAADAGGKADLDEMRRSMMLVATWDTMGWVLYKEGQTAAAEPWVRAAWMNGNAREPGYHLGVILADQGHRTEAMRTLELAQQAGGSGMADETVKKLIEAKKDALYKDGTVSQVSDARAALQNERTFHVPRVTPKLEGWATFQLRIAADGVRTVDVVSGDNALQPMGDALKKLKLEQSLPPASHAELVRLGILSCHAAPDCDFVLVPMSGALAQLTAK